MATDTIPTEIQTANRYGSEHFDNACKMEEPLGKIHDLLTAIMFAGEAMGEGGSSLARIADIARDECRSVEDLRGKLFHGLHPNKESAQ